MEIVTCLVWAFLLHAGGQCYGICWAVRFVAARAWASYWQLTNRVQHISSVQSLLSLSSSQPEASRQRHYEPFHISRTHTLIIAVYDATYARYNGIYLLDAASNNVTDSWENKAEFLGKALFVITVTGFYEINVSHGTPDRASESPKARVGTKQCNYSGYLFLVFSFIPLGQRPSKNANLSTSLIFFSVQRNWTNLIT
jgi:hypothetical protein